MRKAYLQLHIAVFLAGFTAILGKLILLNEGLLVWYRVFMTVCFTGMILFLQKSLRKISRRDFLRMAAAGGVIMIHWVAFFGSVKYGNVSVALVCLSMSGFFSSFIEPLVFRRPVRFFEVLLGLLAVVGIYIIFDFHPQYKLGILFGIVSALGSATFPVFNKKLLQSHNTRELLFYELSGGLLLLTVLLPVYLTAYPCNRWIPSAEDFSWLLVLSVICTVVAFELQLRALKYISAFTSNLSYNLEPVYGIILAFVFFGESKQLNPAFYLGLTLIMLSLGLQMLRVKRNYT